MSFEEHKLYLNTHKFIYECLSFILLYGKYKVIDTELDLSFKKNFMNFDDYLNWCIRNIIIHIKRYIENISDKNNVSIQHIYNIIDDLKNNDDVIYDIEQLLRTLFPISLYIQDKDEMYNSYFELLENYLEYNLLIQPFIKNKYKQIIQEEEPYISDDYGINVNLLEFSKKNTEIVDEVEELEKNEVDDVDEEEEVDEVEEVLDKKKEEVKVNEIEEIKNEKDYESDEENIQKFTDFNIIPKRKNVEEIVKQEVEEIKRQVEELNHLENLQDLKKNKERVEEVEDSNKVEKNLPEQDNKSIIEKDDDIVSESTMSEINHNTEFDNESENFENSKPVEPFKPVETKNENLEPIQTTYDKKIPSDYTPKEKTYTIDELQKTTSREIRSIAKNVGLINHSYLPNNEIMELILMRQEGFYHKDNLKLLSYVKKEELSDILIKYHNIKCKTKTKKEAVQHIEKIVK